MEKEDCGCDGSECVACFMTENDNYEDDDPDAESTDEDF